MLTRLRFAILRLSDMVSTSLVMEGRKVIIELSSKMVLTSE